MFAFLPLITNTYGNPGGFKVNKESSWCFIVTSTDDDNLSVNRKNESDDQVKIEVIWDFFSFYGWIYMSLLLNFFFASTIIFRISREKNRSAEINKSVLKLLVYPIIDLFCWTWTFVVDLKMATDSVKDQETARESKAIPLLLGFFYSIAFFYFNDTARIKWARLWQKWINRLNGVTEDAWNIRITRPGCR